MRLIFLIHQYFILNNWNSRATRGACDLCQRLKMASSDEATAFSSKIQLRSLTVDDQELVYELLMHAAHETSVDVLKKKSELAQYAHDYGTKAADLGVVAMDVKQEPLGGAWVRLLENGYAKDKTIPELAMAVFPEYRGKGIGSRLLESLINEASSCGNKDDFPGICLSCRCDNKRAMQLYKKHGFSQVEGTRVTNRVGGTSVSMVRRFHQGSEDTPSSTPSSS